MSLTVDRSLLLSLPPELLLAIFLELDFSTLQRLRLLSKRIARFAEVALSRYPLWFLPRNRIWFSDENCKGRLMLVNVSSAQNTIEGVEIQARQEHPQAYRWSRNPDVLIHVFEPHISVNTSIFKSHDGEDAGHSSPPFLTQRLPKPSSRSKDELWPPLTIPSATRVKRGDLDEQQRHYIALRNRVPESFSCSTLKLPCPPSPTSPGRSAPEFNTRTWSTLAPQLYRPTAKAPFNGIFVGDYAGHGPEFVLIMHQSSTIMQQQINGKLHVAHSPPLPDHRVPHNGPALSGSIVAVKLTGDESVPRGCLSFVADDLGTNGLIRVADEWPFKGAPVIKSKGVKSASPSSAKYRFVPTQLFLLSKDTIAHYWEESGHISFLQRVDVNKLVHQHGVDCA